MLDISASTAQLMFERWLETVNFLVSSAGHGFICKRWLAAMVLFCFLEPASILPQLPKGDHHSKKHAQTSDCNVNTLCHVRSQYHTALNITNTSPTNEWLLHLYAWGNVQSSMLYHDKLKGVSSAKWTLVQSALSKVSWSQIAIHVLRIGC